MPFVVAQLLHIIGDELNSIRAQKNGQLAEYLFPLIFLCNK